MGLLSNFTNRADDPSPEESSEECSEEETTSSSSSESDEGSAESNPAPRMVNLKMSLINMLMRTVLDSCK